MKLLILYLTLMSTSLGFSLAYNKYKTNLEYVNIKVGSFVHCNEIESLDQRKMEIECYAGSLTYSPKLMADL